MATFTIPKEYIDDTNHLIQDTMFKLIKNSEVGSKNTDAKLTDNELFIYQLLSGEFNLKKDSDYCLVDLDKIIVSHFIYLYQLGINFNTIFKIIKNNKYCYYFLEIFLKDNPFTKEIVENYCNIVPTSYNTIIDCNGNTALIYACSNGMSNVANNLINTFKDLVNPDQVNKFGNTALICACKNNMNNVSNRIINTFNDKVKSYQVNKLGYTALIWACKNNMNDVANNLINTFKDLVKPDQVNMHGNTALIYACWKGMNNVANNLIDTFKDKVKPDQVNKYDNTALIYACRNNMTDVAKKIKELKN